MDKIQVKEASPKQRIASFQEVTLGYDFQNAVKEAKRCIGCKVPFCARGCPVGIDIKKFIQQVAQNDLKAAYSTIKEKNNFPAICGRVCPAEYQCRAACVLNKNRNKLAFCSPEAINIHFLERFVGDYGIKENLNGQNRPASSSSPKVAVVGSGPAGLCAAGELARANLKVEVFEALHKTGGVLRYGIPPFRLPSAILDFEVDYLKKIGVKFATDFLVGKTKSLKQLFSQGFSAVFLGLGAGVPAFLGIKGENLANVYSANEFLTRVNLMGAYRFPDYHTPVNVGKSVVVVGGGNTAMDAARVALRLQKLSNLVPDVTVVYRRSQEEMPARRLEIKHAIEEGIKFEFLVQPVEFYGNSKGLVDRVRCLRCSLGQPDSSGRRRPLVQEGSDFFLASHTAILAVGLGANKVLTGVTPELKVDKYFDLIVNPDTMETSMPGVYAGGDIVGGEGTVIEAMGTAKKAAAAITAYLKKKKS